MIDDYQFIAESALAEDFAELLLTMTDTRLLIASRLRPAWAASRRALHGEVLEIGKSDLAMTDLEATQLLRPYGVGDVDALVGQAQGWPVVIGLAAASGAESFPSAKTASTLFRYIAAEVVRTEQPEVLRLLSLVSMLPNADRQILRELDAGAVSTLIDRLVDEGLIHESGNGHLSLHPLLSDYLCRREASAGEKADQPTWESAFCALAARERWDDAFALAAESGSVELVGRAVAEGSDTLLASGRLETIERWLEKCNELALDNGKIGLVAATVALRRGRLADAAALAEDVARRSEDEPSVGSRAWYIAGQARYLLSDYTAASELFRMAEEHARTSSDNKNALWGQFISALESEAIEAGSLFDRLASMPEGTADDRLRLSTGRIRSAAQAGSFHGVWSSVAASWPYRARSKEPMIRSSFTAMAAYVLVAMAEYERATSWLKRLRPTVANRAGVRPGALPDVPGGSPDRPSVIQRGGSDPPRA